jgi:hypothetical protein
MQWMDSLEPPASSDLRYFAYKDHGTGDMAKANRIDSWPYQLDSDVSHYTGLFTLRQTQIKQLDGAWPSVSRHSHSACQI